jgi:hypothetical protein
VGVVGGIVGGGTGGVTGVEGVTGTGCGMGVVV